MFCCRIADASICISAAGGQFSVRHGRYALTHRLRWFGKNLLLSNKGTNERRRKLRLGRLFK
jgi:hypothetical protein